MNIQIVACFSLIVIGRFEHLDELAKLIALNIRDVQITATEYPVGWRLQLVCKDESTLSSCYTVVGERIKQGIPVEIANGLEPMPTRMYTVREQGE